MVLWFRANNFSVSRQVPLDAHVQKSLFSFLNFFLGPTDDNLSKNQIIMTRHASQDLFIDWHSSYLVRSTLRRWKFDLDTSTILHNRLYQLTTSPNEGLVVLSRDLQLLRNDAHLFPIS